MHYAGLFYDSVDDINLCNYSHGCCITICHFNTENGEIMKKTLLLLALTAAFGTAYAHTPDDDCGCNSSDPGSAPKTGNTTVNSGSGSDSTATIGNTTANSTGGTSSAGSKSSSGAVSGSNSGSSSTGGSISGTLGGASSSNSTSGASTSNASGGTTNSSADGSSKAISGTGGKSSNLNGSSIGNDYSSTNYRSLYIPPVVPATPPSVLASPNVTAIVGACGPLQAVIKTPVQGTFVGMFSESKIDQGFTYELADYVDRNGNIQDYRRVNLPEGGYKLYGHQVINFTAVVGVSGARNFALGGGTGGGSWGQGGTGTSSANQQIVTQIQLRSCEIGTFIPEKPVVIEQINTEPIPYTYKKIPE